MFFIIARILHCHLIVSLIVHFFFDKYGCVSDAIKFNLNLLIPFTRLFFVFYAYLVIDLLKVLLQFITSFDNDRIISLQKMMETILLMSIMANISLSEMFVILNNSSPFWLLFNYYCYYNEYCKKGWMSIVADHRHLLWFTIRDE